MMWLAYTGCGGHAHDVVTFSYSDQVTSFNHPESPAPKGLKSACECGFRKLLQLRVTTSYIRLDSRDIRIRRCIPIRSTHNMNVILVSIVTVQVKWR